MPVSAAGKRVYISKIKTLGDKLSFLFLAAECLPRRLRYFGWCCLGFGGAIAAAAARGRYGTRRGFFG